MSRACLQVSTLTYFPWKASSKNFKGIQKGTFDLHQTLLLHLGEADFMTPQPVLMRLSAQISRAQRGQSFYFQFLLVISMLTCQMFLGKAFIVTMHNKYLCFEQSSHIKFVIITIQSKSCCNLLNFQLIKALTICQPLY